MNEDAFLAKKSAVVFARNRNSLVDVVLILDDFEDNIRCVSEELFACNKIYLRVDEFHDGLLQVIQVHSILGRSTSNDIVLIVIVTTHRSKLLGVGELDVHAILLHDALDATATDTDDTFMVSLRHMEGDLGRKFFLK